MNMSIQIKRVEELNEWIAYVMVMHGESVTRIAAYIGDDRDSVLGQATNKIKQYLS